MALNKEYVRHVEDLKAFLLQLKKDTSEKSKSLSVQEQDSFVKDHSGSLFKELDSKFDVLDEDFKDITEAEFQQRKSFYVKELHPFLGEGIDTNTYIRRKPLGYAGDYVTMNLIYDSNAGVVIGSDLYSKLINLYTCSIDVANSNIHRKAFLKTSILSFLSNVPEPSFLSVGCGPAREIIELLKENKIKGDVTFHLLDLEKNALRYIQEELDLIKFDRDKIKVHCYLFDLLEIIKNKKITEIFSNIDFIYVSGVFDYLSDRACKKVVHNLAKIAKTEVVFFNMSLENSRHRSYYEVFGEWVMYHRTRSEVLKWGEGLIGFSSSIVDFPDCKSYWILRVRRT